MGVSATVFHVLTMTSPVDAAYENTPNNWNSSHAITLSQDGIGTISSYQNVGELVNTSALTFNGASVSGAVAFTLPQAGSFSFLRIPVLMTTNSTTVASAAGLSTGGGFVYRTWNAVAYSYGTGASSKSLVSYKSGSHAETVSNSFSFSAANSAWSVSQGYTFNVAGVQTSVSSQYSATSASLNLSTNYLTNVSSLRWLDINFANSLSAGPYWLVIGYSSSSTTSGQSGGPLTNAGVSYSNHYAVTQVNSWFNQLNDTAGSSGDYLGAGSFSTAGGGTTVSIPLSALSSAANNPQMYFQLLRSA